MVARSHLFIEGGIFYFNALYKCSNEFPAPRIYYIKTQYLGQVAQIIKILHDASIVFPIVDEKSFSQLIEDFNYNERLAVWSIKWDRKCKPFMDLARGRQNNTAVTGGVWLNTDNCLICGGEEFLMFTSTIMSDESGMMVGANLCKNHGDEFITKETFLNYLARKAGVPVPPVQNDLTHVTPTEMINWGLELLVKNLDCKIEKTDGNTVTGLRKSGFRIILRQENMLNYAYIIQDPNKKLVARIDSARHHKINYGPDHLHRDLTKELKNNVEASFTYGIALMDIKAIKKLIEEAENKYPLEKFT